jgi:glycosyltransferase involved in cell wall biosynthesis
MIPSYNCSTYLVETIRSVLAQDPGAEKMQIEVIDDFSTDADVEKLVHEVGQGRVKFFRQKKNRGSLRNFETCLNRATGEWIHLLHGDDLVRPGFYQEIEKLFALHPDAGAAFTGHTHIDQNGKALFRNLKILDRPGIIPDWLSKIAICQLLQAPAMVVKRSVYERLGGFFAVHYAEDWEMWARIAAHYPVAHSPRDLAQYRVHGSNITSQYFQSGQSISDILKVIDIIQQYLPEEKRKSVKTKSLVLASKYFARNTDKVYHDFKNPAMALRLAKRAMSLDMNKTTVYRLFKIYLKLLVSYKNGHNQKLEPEMALPKASAKQPVLFPAKSSKRKSAEGPVHS